MYQVANHSLVAEPAPQSLLSGNRNHSRNNLGICQSNIFYGNDLKATPEISFVNDPKAMRSRKREINFSSANCLLQLRGKQPTVCNRRDNVIRCGATQALCKSINQIAL